MEALTLLVLGVTRQSKTSLLNVISSLLQAQRSGSGAGERRCFLLPVLERQHAAASSSELCLEGTQLRAVFGAHAADKRPRADYTDTELLTAQHILDNGCCLDLRVLDAPPLGELVGSSQESTAIHGIVSLAAQQGPVHAVVICADGSMDQLSSSDLTVFQLLLGMLQQAAAASVLAVFTDCSQPAGCAEPARALQQLRLDADA